MRKITVGATISLDGVMQSPGGPNEDPTSGFTLGGWQIPHRSPESREELNAVFEEPFDLLLGRKTYEIFAAFWPYQPETPPFGSIAKKFNEASKYVVSRSGELDTGWQGSVLLRDVAAVGRLKEEDGPNLLTQGSGELVHALFAHDLVDAMSIFTVPIVLGSGKKLFADGAAPRTFKLTRSRVSATGVFIGHYERAGAIETVDGGTPSPSEREVARQARMTREG